MGNRRAFQIIRGVWQVLLCFVFVFAFSSSVFAMQSAFICGEALQGLEKAGPTVLPKAPPAPERVFPLEPEPIRTVPRPTIPKRREVPIPVPDQPGRQIPAKPLEDPKDIQPEDLYSTDLKVAFFWREMPVGLKRLMIEEIRKEKAKYEAHMTERYGGADARTLLRAVLSLQGEIESIEALHKEKILNVIRQMMEKRYGTSVKNLDIKITKDLPLPSRQIKADGRMIPELPQSLDEGMIYRTELRNLWLQGEGWLGMKEFAFSYADELNAIHPGLAEKYQELDRLYRIGQIAQLDLLPTAEILDSLSLDDRARINNGREIVRTDFEIVDGVDGTPSVRWKNVTAVAAGKNGWAAAHEARKAASHMVTPSEGAYRWMMPQERREKLDEATNSARAEIRQGVFGPAVVQALKKRIDLILKKSLDDQQYYQIMDGYFSLPPALFIHLNKVLFDSAFESNPALQREAQNLLIESGVLE